jgi:hypothetical protein
VRPLRRIESGAARRETATLEGVPMLTVMCTSLCLVAGSALGPPAVHEWIPPCPSAWVAVVAAAPDSAAVAPRAEDAAAAPKLSTAERSSFTGGGESFVLAAALFATPSWFILLEQDEGAWVGGSNLFLAALFGLSPGREKADPHWPMASRLAYIGGMSGLAAYEIVHDEDFTDGELFWTNLAGVTVTLFVTDLLFKRGR